MKCDAVKKGWEIEVWAQPLWRGSLLPLGCEAVVAFKDGAAARPSGSKLPRHRSWIVDCSLSVNNQQLRGLKAEPPNHAVEVHGQP
ncbi:hypothetical protein B1219_03000 [Pseudomonas ogarae]|nr:hypothetical protein B1219_03000 [Pseudomonas ogarae]OPG77087.1 hypothetical protein B1218_22670 [Pseudomonas ogarae]